MFGNVKCEGLVQTPQASLAQVLHKAELVLEGGKEGGREEGGRRMQRRKGGGAVRIGDGKRDERRDERCEGEGKGE